MYKFVRKLPLNQSYCRFYTRMFNEKRAKLQENIEQGDKSTETLLERYEEKLLYNTVIEANRLRYGYRKNMEIYTKQMRFAERMKTTLKTVQPLPLSLKYLEGMEQPIEKKDNTESNLNNETNAESNNSITNLPFVANTTVAEVCSNSLSLKPPMTIKEEIIGKKNVLDQSGDNWMSHYENYEHDLDLENDSLSLEEDWKINYGTPDPDCPISKTPCGGCGAYLHCKDSSIPGYIPSEIFKNSFNPGGANLPSIHCQRCHFLKEYNIALQVRVTAEDYPKVLQAIPFNSSLAVLMVDLMDFPCSIWPGIADILGRKSPVVVVGNKVDLLPKDDKKFLQNITKVLVDNLKLNGFANSNVKHLELISAKTGYGVENLITNLHRVWRAKGDVYLIGCTNVGKSSLFNLLLQSDFCKIQAVDLIQRATTSVWPGTTLNLLKFPLTRFSGYRLFARHKRLEALKKIENEQRKLNKEALRQQNIAKHATLIGHIGRTIEHLSPETELDDSFSVKGSPNLTGMTKMGINENRPEFVYGKWCYDTPGVVHPDQILHLLTTDELVKTLPRDIIRPETYCVKPGVSLFIAGLARLDYVEGPDSIRLTVFKSKDLPLTICRTEEADATYDELLGSELLAVPILKGDRNEKWPGLELAKTFKIFGKSIKESSYDVVLSSAGWVAINCGLNHYKFNAWTPEKRGVHIRDCILPKAVLLRGARIRDSVAYKKHRFIQ